MGRKLLSICCLCVCLTGSAKADEVDAKTPATLSEQVRAAVDSALPLVEKASAGSAAERKCFTCHSQAMPVLAVSSAKQLGFSVDEDNLERQIDHTARFLKRGQENYDAGKGQGGGVDTAGFALWTLSQTAHPRDETTASVTGWLLQKQRTEGFWKCSSNRPPSEKSNFTTTYVALRGLSSYGTAAQSEAILEKRAAALDWLTNASTGDTEDAVFRLLSLSHLEAAPDVIESAVQELKASQQADGGWAQTTELSTDAYATATALYALHVAGDVSSECDAFQRGVSFLLSTQKEDGSWHITSRSDPFQEYFETGFPHGEDQFISTSATCWAIMAMLPAVEQPSDTDHADADTVR